MTPSNAAMYAERLIERARIAYVAQDLEAGWRAITDAIRKAPDQPLAAFMRAQIAYASWRPAVELFERAVQLNPGNREVLRNFLLALVSEGQGARAERLLVALLDRDPAWLEGHTALATLRSTRGDDDPERSYASACAVQPGNLPLHLAWFHRLATAQAWDRAERAQKLAESHFPDALGVRLHRAYLSCESGHAAGDDADFAGLDAIDDPGFDLLRVRHYLRSGEPGLAAAIAERRLSSSAALQFWPYCSLAWRLTDDTRKGWLEGEPLFATHADLPLGAEELGHLAVFLRELHKMNAPYPEQSVRGGTQTDRNLLLHHDPIICALRGKIETAVKDWRDALPPDDAGHPLLGRKPDKVRFTGSWSVRLASGGHHSAHTHPKGWASSALYVKLPKTMGAGHAGELAIGQPPPELGLGLEPAGYISPKPARLALFPSTSWHGTIPFEGEERLTVAFDVAPSAVSKGLAA